MLDLPHDQAWQRVTAALGAIAVFCQRSVGSPMLTVTSLLYDADPEQETAARQAKETVRNSVVVSARQVV